MSKRPHTNAVAGLCQRRSCADQAFCATYFISVTLETSHREISSPVQDPSTTLSTATLRSSLLENDSEDADVHSRAPRRRRTRRTRYVRAALWPGRTEEEADCTVFHDMT